MTATAVIPAPVKPQNVCSLCGLDFTAVEGFEKHKTGTHAYLYSPEQPDGRRCRTIEEMRELGFLQNEYGRWYLPAPEGSKPDWSAIRARRG